ncbi:MAG: paraquat-inducible protein A [Candidatus Omnitrophota bacterium]|nr:paraquat-inducible protein A [Candidatus Omnitrophota bacterium]
MPEQKTSLLRAYPRCWDVPLVLLTSIVLLILGLCLPVITLQELVFWKTTFSVWAGIVSLFQERHYFLSVIIFLFSIIFPIGKLTILLNLWFIPMPQLRRKFFIHWLSVLGKWSMLDVFVVAVMIVITKISGFASADARIGIYFFGASILLSLLVTERIERLMKNPK